MSHIHSVLWNQIDAEGEFFFSLNFLTISIVEERVIAAIEGANYVAMYKPAGEKSIWYFNASQTERWSLNELEAPKNSNYGSAFMVWEGEK